MARGQKRDSWSSLPQSVRDRLRHHVFARDGYECQIKGPRCNGRAEDLDHIIPRTVDESRILDPNNCRASCIPCNRGYQSKRTAPPSRDW